jgi:hypothetical protein
MKKLIFAIISMVLLSACSLSPEEVALKNKELEIYAAAMAKPTIICTNGCEYTDPRRNITLAKETNGWDFANTLVKTTANVAMTAVPYAALGVVAVEGIKSSGGNTYNDGSFNSEANQANQQSTETVNGIKANGNVDQSQHNQNNPNTTTETTTNTDNNSVNDSNNGGNDNSTTNPETIAETKGDAP